MNKDAYGIAQLFVNGENTPATEEKLFPPWGGIGVWAGE